MATVRDIIRFCSVLLATAFVSGCAYQLALSDVTDDAILASGTATPGASGIDGYMNLSTKNGRKISGLWTFDRSTRQGIAQLRLPDGKPLRCVFVYNQIEGSGVCALPDTDREIYLKIRQGSPYPSPARNFLDKPPPAITH